MTGKGESQALYQEILLSIKNSFYYSPNSLFSRWIQMVMESTWGLASFALLLCLSFYQLWISCILFLIPLGVRLGCLFDIFNFPEIGLYCYKTLS